MIPKNPGIAQEGIQKSGSSPEKVPKKMAHPHITTNASLPPGAKIQILTYLNISKYTRKIMEQFFFEKISKLRR